MSLMPVYANLPISFSRGEGCWLYDHEDKKYLDALSGVAVCGLGHCHPAVTKAICEQAKLLLHVSNVVRIDQQIELAEKLTAATQMEQAFFVNSGAEALETAIKLARLYGHQQNIDNPQIIVMESAFHGRTMATLTASGNRKIQAGFEPLVPGFVRAPYNNLDALEMIARNSQGIVAILVEPIQGEGGVHIPDENYLQGIRQICDKYNWLMMLDEVQTGNGRTGKFYAYQHYNLLPDVLATAKGLGNGFPIGACLARDRASNVFKVGNHGSTFGGNPLACRVGITVLETLIQEKIPENAAKVGAYLLEKLKQTFSNHALVRNIRGKGLIIGVELDRPCRDLMSIGLEQGLLFNVTADSVVRLLPPLILNKQEADMIVERLKVCIEKFSRLP